MITHYTATAPMPWCRSCKTFQVLRGGDQCPLCADGVAPAPIPAQRTVPSPVAVPAPLALPLSVRAGLWVRARLAPARLARGRCE